MLLVQLGLFTSESHEYWLEHGWYVDTEMTHEELARALEKVIQPGPCTWAELMVEDFSLTIKTGVDPDASHISEWLLNNVNVEYCYYDVRKGEWPEEV